MVGAYRNRKQVPNRLYESGEFLDQSTCRLRDPTHIKHVISSCRPAVVYKRKHFHATRPSHEIRRSCVWEKTIHGSISELVYRGPSSSRKCWVRLCCWCRRVCDHKAWVFLEVARSVALWNSPCLNGSKVSVCVVHAQKSTTWGLCVRGPLCSGTVVNLTSTDVASVFIYRLGTTKLSRAKANRDGRQIKHFHPLVTFHACQLSCLTCTALHTVFDSSYT